MTPLGVQNAGKRLSNKSDLKRLNRQHFVLIMKRNSQHTPPHRMHVAIADGCVLILFVVQATPPKLFIDVSISESASDAHTSRQNKIYYAFIFLR